MAATLNDRLPEIAAVGLAGLLLLGAGQMPAARAADPTQPPEHLLRNLSPGSGGAPHGNAEPPAAPIVLQAILHADGRPARIMVDGWLYRIGDTVHGNRLVTIGRHHAEFDAHGRRQTIALIPQAGITRLRLDETETGPAPASAIAPTRTKPARVPARRPNKENP